MKSLISTAMIVLVARLLVGWRPVVIENLRFTGSFESGQIQRSGSAQDGFYIQTLPDPQGDVDYVKVSSGGAGPDSGLDTRVVSSERVGS